MMTTPLTHAFSFCFSKKKPLLLLTACLICQNSIANPPQIEQRSLTQPSHMATNTTTNNAEWQLTQKIEQLQQELREVRGLLETNTQNQNNKLADFADQLKDVHQRISLQEDALVEVRNQIDGSNANSTPLTQAPQSSDDAKQRYIAAYNRYKTQGAKAGIAAMDNFIESYPTDLLVPSAHYWIGEFYLSEKKPNFAAAELRFSAVVKQYPQSEKAPRALYRLATLADADNRKDLATTYMQQIITDYPNTEQAELAQRYLK